MTIDWALPPRHTTMLGDQVSPTNTEYPPPYWNRWPLSSSLYRQPVASPPMPAQSLTDARSATADAGTNNAGEGSTHSGGLSRDDDDAKVTGPEEASRGGFATGVQAASGSLAARAMAATVTTPAPSSAAASLPPDHTQGPPTPPLAVLVGDLAPKGKQSLSAIAATSFSLGMVCGLSATWVAWAIYADSAFLRLPVFLVALSVFHFLEFWTTAAYNTPVVEVDSFLLFSNGPAYTLAHTCAVTEFVVTTLASRWYPSYSSSSLGISSSSIPSSPFSSSPFSSPSSSPSLSSSGGIILRALGSTPVAVAGVSLIVIGQAVRTGAMAQAGRSFHHKVQETRAASHTLVTSGLYAVMRHPSYFGFFWWAVGTQLLLGNKICLLGYCAALHKFFSSRIHREEAYLVKFFGDRYVDYRKKTRTLIPFV